MEGNNFDLKGFLNDPKVQADKAGAMRFLQQKGIVDATGNLIKKAPVSLVAPNTGLPSTSDTGTQGGDQGFNPATDISGYDTRKAGGIVGGLIQDTIGSRGLAGVAQLPGKVAADAVASSDVQKFSESASAMYDHATSLLKQAQTEVDPSKKTSLRKQANALIEGAHTLSDHANSLGKFNVTPGQAIGNTAQAALTLATAGTESVAENLGLTGFKALGTRVAEGAATSAAFQGANNLLDKESIGKDTGKAAIIGGAIPVAGAVLSRGKQLFGKVLNAAGTKVENSIIKPSSADIKDGFDIKNIQKHDLGGDLPTILSKTTQKMSDLTAQLRAKIGASDKTIDVGSLIDQTEAELKKNSLANFGDNKKITAIIQGLRDEVTDILHNPNVNIADAQVLKQAVGLKGAWQYGRVDPDAKASETVFSNLYSKIKTAIEKSSPEGVKELNKQLSELIPISKAVIRRIPVEARNNAISLTDSMGLIASALDPKALGVTLLNRALKSGTAANVAMKAGSAIQEASSVGGALGRKIFGR